MKASELRGRDAQDLRRELAQLKRELFDLRFQWQAEESPDSNRRRLLKKDIARYKSVLREMELEQETPAAG
ncbi:MAG: 50S ribosomal protein L29 [Planctomycetota bacterium]|jgi:large subunit ribosomal protein L29